MKKASNGSFNPLAPIDLQSQQFVQANDFVTFQNRLAEWSSLADWALPSATDKFLPEGFLPTMEGAKSALQGYDCGSTLKWTQNSNVLDGLNSVGNSLKQIATAYAPPKDVLNGVKQTSEIAAMGLNAISGYGGVLEAIAEQDRLTKKLAAIADPTPFTPRLVSAASPVPSNKFSEPRPNKADVLVMPTEQQPKVLPLSPAVETNKLLRQLIKLQEAQQQDREIDRQELRQLKTQNRHLLERVAKLEADAEARNSRQLAVQEKTAQMVEAMYYDVGIVASFVRDTREELGGPPLNNLPTLDESDETDDDVEE